MPYLIDGYNLARVSRQNVRQASQEIDGLVRFLNRFARLKKTKVTVVFDGFPPDWNRSHRLSSAFDAVRILFAGDETDADTKIRNMIGSLQNRSGWTVVSSDRAVHGYARASGVRAIRSDEFLRTAEKAFSQRVKEDPEVRSEEVDYWLEIFGEKKTS